MHTELSLKVSPVQFSTDCVPSMFMTSVPREFLP